MSPTKWIVIGLMGAMPVWGQTVTNLDLHATSDGVNLRARPDAQTEVVAQAHEGQVLSAIRVEGEWFGVLAPTNAGVWIKSVFVTNGVVTGNNIRLRSGPGIGYRDVGVVRKGDVATRQDAHGEWLKIAPPTNLVLWVNRSVVEAGAVDAEANMPALEPTAATAATAPTDGQIEVSTNAVLSHDLPAGLTTDQLAPALGQGATVGRTGVVERVPLALFRGADYRLIETREGHDVTLCYLKGNDIQMASLTGRRMSIKGRQYRLIKLRYPLVYPDLIAPVLVP